jgi:hypothetical protein
MPRVKPALRGSAYCVVVEDLSFKVFNSRTRDFEGCFSKFVRIGRLAKETKTAPYTNARGR